MRLCDTLFSVIRNLFRRFLLSKKIPTDTMISCPQIACPSMFYLKTVPTNAIISCPQIACPSLFYLKTVPVSAMKACFQIAECSLFYIKTVNAKPRFHVFRTVFTVVRRCHAKKRGDNLL